MHCFGWVAGLSFDASMAGTGEATLFTGVDRATILVVDLVLIPVALPATEFTEALEILLVLSYTGKFVVLLPPAVRTLTFDAADVRRERAVAVVGVDNPALAVRKKCGEKMWRLWLWRHVMLVDWHPARPRRI